MHADFLYIVAEIAAAFAGFSSLVAAISRRSEDAPEPISPRSEDAPEQLEMDFRTLRNVLLLSLQAVLYALLPNLLERQGLTPEVAFRIAGAFLFMAGGAYVLFTIRQLPNAYHQLGRTVPSSFKLNAGLILAGCAMQAASALGLVPIHTYLVSLSFFVYCAGFGFVRLFVSLRPV